MRLRLGIVLAAFLGLAACQTGPYLRGQAVSRTTAPDFELVSQSGQPLRLAELQGRVVVLTFLDTDCTGDCPDITSKLIETAGQIDYSESGRVAFLAVTTNPEEDNVEKAAQFCHLNDMPANFYFLTGARPAVEAVWAGFYPSNTTPAASPLAKTRLAVIDPVGDIRSYFSGPDFAPDDLRHDIRALLSEENLLALPLCH
ncbi:MAG: SCO family protein [Chloroflexi bacterium]|nr:SCO family protein [Chloroflexota bacterium]